MLLLLLACAPSVEPERVDCVRGDDPPGDPIYRDCIIRGESRSASSELRTDSEGRTIALRLPNGSWEWEREWEGACEVSTTTTCTGFDGASCGAWLTTRVCDSEGNPTTTIEEYTRDDGDTRTTTTDTRYLYDEAGRAVVTASTPRDADTAPSTRTCWYSDWEAPDRCVVNPTSDTNPYDDWHYAWTYDEGGLPTSSDVSCMNPGYFASQSWERDESGRTLEWTEYDTATSETREHTYAYRGRVVDIMSASTYGATWGGPFTTVYTYEMAD